MDQHSFLTTIEISDMSFGAGNESPTIGLAPGDLVAADNTPDIDLTWTNNDTYTGVIIYRKTTGDFEPIASIAGDQFSYTDDTVSLDVEYTYVVRGVKSGYPTPYSNEDSATVPAVTLKAAQNAATTGNWLDAGNAAGLQVTKDDTFIVGGWIKWADSVDAVPFTKGDVFAGTESYGMFLTGETGIISAVSHNGTSDTSIDANDPIVSGTKSFVVMWHDGTNLKIKIDAGTVASTACPRTQVADPGGNFVLFATDDGSGGNGTKCVIDEWFFCKNPSDIAAALSLISTTIYNSGSGTHYDALQASDITTLGLVSWWGLDEASAATRNDLNSTNDLSLNGTITQVPPLTV